MHLFIIHIYILCYLLYINEIKSINYYLLYKLE